VQTVWSSLDLLETTEGAPGFEGLLPLSCAVVLHDTPHIVSLITLPLTTARVLLWTAQEQLWYAIDGDPGPIPAPVGGTLVAATAFVPGGIVVPGAWHLVLVAAASLPHTLHLVSAAQSPTVFLTAYTEMT
jgi:hypothetical protein